MGTSPGMALQAGDTLTHDRLRRWLATESGYDAAAHRRLRAYLGSFDGE